MCAQFNAPQPKGIVMSRVATGLALAGAMLLIGAGAATADDAMGVLTVPDNSKLNWQPAPPTLPHTMSLVVLAGDPSKPGPFVLRVLMPPNTVIAPHTHKTAENLTVISGDFYHAHGDKVDKSQGTEVHTGGFVYLPAMHAHYLWTTTEPAVLQVTGTGPFGVDYINPADDPSKPHG
jgi:quercetin dioxygenase-like cupin family protein